MAEVDHDAERARDAFEQGWKRIPKGPTALSDSDRSLAWDLLAKCRSGHRFNGAAGTRGMMVTDGSFSPGVAAAAQERGIRLIDGGEITRMLGG